MLCDKCKKNEATVHIKEFHNGKCTNLNLCSQCADNSQAEEVFPGIGFNLAEVLMNVKKFASHLQSGGEDNQQEQHQTLICPECGWDPDKLRQHDGKVGCPHCYYVFNDIIKEAVSQVHRGALHLGKRPQELANNSPAVLRLELEKIRQELQELISAEEYEAAAICRDRINMLKKELETLEQGENK